MKTILRLSSLFILTVFFLYSCKKDETKLYYTGGTPPALSVTTAADTPSYANADKTVLTLKWTNPNYTFTTGASSYDVSYKLEIDVAGSNFTNPNKKVIGISQDLSYSFTSAQLNDVMLNQLNLDTAKRHDLEFRIVSNLVNGSAELVSNSVQYSATAYAIPPKVTPLPDSTMYIVGSAVGSWDNPIAPANVSNQKFEKVSSTEYKITIQLIANGSYKFIGKNGSWDLQWSTANKNDPDEIYGGDFVFNGQDVLAPPETAVYTIDVDFQKGKFTVTK